MKIVINTCHGGFSISDAAVYRYAEIKGITLYPEREGGIFSRTAFYTVPKDQRVKPLFGNWMDHSEKVRKAHNDRSEKECLYDRDMKRDDSILVQVVEELGRAANGIYAELKVVEIPDGVEWKIEEYDGAEWIAEKHRTWS